MGSRGNVYITSTVAPEYQQGAQGMYLYSHYDGHQLPFMVQQALTRAKDRWSDDMYLARILVDQVTRSGRDETVGYGLGLAMGDNSFPITVVDMGQQAVWFASPGHERDQRLWLYRNSFGEVADMDGALKYPSDLFS